MTALVSASVYVMIGLSLAAAIVYTFVGQRLGLRQTSSEGALANRAFQAWWFMLAASALLTGVIEDALAVAGIDNLATFLSITILNLLVVSLALAGLLYYLIFVYTGSARAGNAVVAFYIGGFVFLLWMILDAGPTGVVIAENQAEIAYATPLESSPLWLALVAVVLLPQIGGAFAYFLLFFRLDDVTSRYRTFIVSWSILVWFGSSLVASASGLADVAWWPVASRSIGLGAAIAVYWAYYPPTSVRDRFGIRPLSAPEVGR